MLGVNPAAARVGLPNGYLPLHVLLMQSAMSGDASSKAAAAAAAGAAAASKPLLKKLLEVHPEGAQARIMQGLTFPLGHLPLFLAIQRG